MSARCRHQGHVIPGTSSMNRIPRLAELRSANGRGAPVPNGSLRHSPASSREALQHSTGKYHSAARVRAPSRTRTDTLRILSKGARVFGRLATSENISLKRASSLQLHISRVTRSGSGRNASGLRLTPARRYFTGIFELARGRMRRGPADMSYQGGKIAVYEEEVPSIRQLDLQGPH
jgi:hypothetical protein